jgi:hypothetical protein
MARFLKQSTTITLRYGPFLDDTDFKTEETALSPTMELSKNGGAFAARNSATATAHDSNGWYSIEMNATDTNTLGPLTTKVDAAGHLPVWEHFMVVPAEVYDALVAGTGVGMRSDVRGWLGTVPATPTVAGVPEVDLTHIAGDAQSGTDLKDFADAGYDPATNKVQGVVLVDTLTTYTGNTPQTGDAFARLGAPAGASVSADIAAIEAQTDDIGVAGAGLTALGDARLANLDAAVSTRATPAQVNTEVDVALDTAIPGVPTAGSVNERLKTMDDADLPARLPAALVGGRIDASVGAMAAAVITAAAHAAGAIDALAVATDAWEEAADVLLNRNLATGTDSGTETVRTVRQALRVLRNKVSIAAGTLTVTKEDDTTASWTGAVTTTAGDPISAVDPASA